VYNININKEITMTIAEKFAEALNQKFSEDTFTVEAGQKFDRIVYKSRWNNGGSCHAFVEKATGNLIKSATWRAPQKSVKHPSGLAVRFELATEEGFEAAVKAADIFGGYLYDKK
jgi:hypothetical protein